MGNTTKKDSNIFSKLLINVVVPIVIIDSFYKATLEFDLIYLPLAALIVVVSLTFFGYIFSRLLMLKNKTRGSFITIFPTLEGGTIGYAFMLAAFGEIGLSRIVLFDAANAIYLFIVVYFISCILGGTNMSVRESVVKIFKTPLIWAIFIGIFLNLIGFQNIFVSNLFDVIGKGFLFLVMIFLGLEFQPSISSLKLPFITIGIKTAIGLLLGVVVSMIFGLGGVERIAVIIGSSLPPSIITLIFAKENNLDVEYTANLISVALIFAIIFLSILINFL